MADKKKPAMCPMVGWYDPIQLGRTAVDVAVSTLFGKNADYRLMEALATPDNDDPGGTAGAKQADKHGVYPFDDADSIWIDYVSDTGDGWNSTYAVAHSVGREALEIDGAGKLPRGQVLIFGGDEVYPVAHRDVYRDRLVEPFESALAESGEQFPYVFAVPGNHDWYDSLVSFTRLFCSQRWFGGWKTCQERSYFALRLPHHWWLIGTDVQLDSDIDVPQVKYFKQVAAQMKEQDRIILCTAEPHWIYATTYGKDDSNINEDNLAFLENKIFCRKISVFLSGDLHHYRRHENSEGRQKITAGGGGAFLHPTHGLDVSVLEDGYRLKAAYPPISKSKAVAWGNLAFLFKNWKFGLLTAALYTLTCWSVMTDLSQFGVRDTWPAVKTAIHASISKPAPVFWIGAVFFGFVFFTDTHSKVYRWIAGPIHGLAHLACTFVIGWIATCLTVSEHRPFQSTYQLVPAGAIIFVLGWVVGSIVMGLYLLISLNVFKRHANEAFSALASPDWKNFLKLRIDSDGTLTIFPIGIRKVPRDWDETGGIPRFEPKDKTATPPALIETPIVIK